MNLPVSHVLEARHKLLDQEGSCALGEILQLVVSILFMFLVCAL